MGRYGHHAEFLEKGARGGEGDGASFHVGHDTAGDDVVVVAVEDGIDTRQLRGQAHRGGHAVAVAEMRQQHDEVGTRGTGGIDTALHRGGKAIGREVVDEVAVRILETGGVGGVHGGGSGDTHKGDGQPTQMTQHKGLEGSGGVAVEVTVVGRGVVVGVHVAAEQRCGEHRLKVAQLLEAEVEFVVAQAGSVVADGIHQADDEFALGGGTNGAAEREVASRDNGHMAAHALQAVAQAGKHGIAVDGTVHVVFV